MVPCNPYRYGSAAWASLAGHSGRRYYDDKGEELKPKPKPKAKPAPKAKKDK